jgi:hypothetical protein
LEGPEEAEARRNAEASLALTADLRNLDLLFDELAIKKSGDPAVDYVLPLYSTPIKRPKRARV